MSDQVPSQPPPGYKWIKTLLGFGPWQLVVDEENPLPPPGYRWAINFWTAKKELVAVVGKGVEWFDPKDTVSRPKPASLIDQRNPTYITPQIQPDKISKEVTAVE